MIVLPKKDKQGQYTTSYSQISTWRKSKKDYIREYFFGDRQTDNPYFAFGSKVGEGLEKGDFSKFTLAEKETLSKVERLDFFEKYIEIPFEGFKLIGYIDTVDEGLNYLIDYKTGTQDKIPVYKEDDYLQLKLYAAAIKQETGKLPKKAKVILIERLGNPYKGEDMLVGEGLWEIPNKITKADVDRATEIVQQSAEEISEYYKVFLKLNI